MRATYPIAVSVLMACLAICSMTHPCQAAKPGEGELKLVVVDKATGKPVPCRIHLKNQAGVPRKALGMPFWFDHFVFPGEVKLKLPKGNYTFVVERGPEYVDVTGHFMIVDYSDDEKVIELKRAVNMADEGWWSGDLHVCRPVREVELAMQAEDLHVAGVVTWDNKKSQWPADRYPEETTVRFDDHRFYHLMTGKDARAGGTLLLFGLQRPLGIVGLGRDYPPSLDIAILARQANKQAWLDAAMPTDWDLPLWLAAGQVQSIELLNGHMLRAGMAKSDAGGKPRDKTRFPDPLGAGMWSEAIYHHVLNCGLQIPPSAGSGSGDANNPLGYNRVYVQLPKEELSVAAWWDGLRAGRSVVTNGPLIRPIANGELPGHVFRVSPGEELLVDVAMNLATRDRIAYLEIIENGQVASSIRLEQWAKTGHFPPLKIKRGGWFLVRAVTQNEQTYRLASSAPWYVEVAGEPARVSRRSAQFFLDWVNERAAMIKLADPDEQAGVMRYFETARTFWEALVARANAD